MKFMMHQREWNIYIGDQFMAGSLSTCQHYTSIHTLTTHCCWFLCIHPLWHIYTSYSRWFATRWFQLYTLVLTPRAPHSEMIWHLQQLRSITRIVDNMNAQNVSKCGVDWIDKDIWSSALGTRNLWTDRWAQGISLSADAPKDHPGGQGCVSRHGCSKDLYLEDEVGQEDQAEQVREFWRLWRYETLEIYRF